MKFSHVKWTLKHSVGLLGLIIIILSLQYLNDTFEGFLIVFSDHRLSILSVLTGFPLIPLIASSKQKQQIRYYDEIGHGEFSSGVTVFQAEYNIPNAVWLSHVKTTVMQTTDFDQSIQIAHTWSTEDELYEWNDATDYVVANLLDVDAVEELAEIVTPYPVTHFHNVGPETVDPADFSHQYRDYRYYEAGEAIVSTTFMSDRDAGSPPTAGNVQIISIATFVIVCFGHGGDKRGGRKAMYVSIAWYTGTDNLYEFGWVAPSDGRIGNIRLTNWSSWDNSVSEYMLFDPHPMDLSLTQDTLHLTKKPWIYIDNTAVKDFDNVEKLLATVYTRGVKFVNKNEPITYRTNCKGAFQTLSFQFIPDYLNRFEFSRAWETADADSNERFLPLFVVPYDVYIETIEFEGSITVTAADNNASLWLVSLKRGYSPSALDTMMIGFTGATVQGGILGSNQGSGALPNWIHDLVSVGSGAAGTQNFQSLEMILDFYEAGSVIGIFVPNNFNVSVVSALSLILHIEGTNQVKTSWLGNDYLGGSQMMDLNEVPVL